MDSKDLEAKDSLQKHFNAYQQIYRDFPDLIRICKDVATNILNFANKNNNNVEDVKIENIIWTPNGKIFMDVIPSKDPKQNINGTFQTGFSGFDEMMKRLPTVFDLFMALGSQLIAFAYRKRYNTRKIQFGNIDWGTNGDKATMSFSIYNDDKIITPKEAIIE